MATVNKTLWRTEDAIGRGDTILNSAGNGMYSGVITFNPALMDGATSFIGHTTDGKTVTGASIESLKPAGGTITATSYKGYWTLLMPDRDGVGLYQIDGVFEDTGSGELDAYTKQEADDRFKPLSWKPLVADITDAGEVGKVMMAASTGRECLDALRIVPAFGNIMLTQQPSSAVMDAFGAQVGCIRLSAAPTATKRAGVLLGDAITRLVASTAEDVAGVVTDLNLVVATVNNILDQLKVSKLPQ